jgi:hypothetical protein
MEHTDPDGRLEVSADCKPIPIPKVYDTAHTEQDWEKETDVLAAMIDYNQACARAHRDVEKGQEKHGDN